MKRIKIFILILVLCLLPIPVFAREISEEEAISKLAIFGLAPGNQSNPAIFQPANYEYEGEILENFRMINTANLVGNTSTVSCDSFYTDREQIQIEDRDAYKVDEYGVCYVGETTNVISYDIFNQHYNDLYGTNAPKKDISFLAPFTFAIYDYDELSDQFIQLSVRGNGGSVSGTVIDIFKVRSADDVDTADGFPDGKLTIVVSTQSVILENGKYTLGNKEYTDMRGQAEVESSIYSDHLDEVNTYEVVIKKTDSHYELYSITKVDVANVGDTAAFSSICIYIIGIFTLIIGECLWLFARKTNKMIKEV